MNYASRSTRLIGQILDGFVAATPIIVASFIAARTNILGAMLLVVAALWGVGYLLLADGMDGGQSIGKRWLGKKVIDESTGNPCSFGQSFVRNLLLSVLGPIDWIFIFGDRHQRLGDKLAGTVVVDAA